MKAKWFSESYPAHGQLIGFTWNGRSSDPNSDDPFPGPYSSWGRWDDSNGVIVRPDLTTWRVEAGFAWHPLGKQIEGAKTID